MNTHRLLGITAIFLFTSVTLAQTNTGQIKGVLRDHSRGVIPGANVTATNVATGLTVARVTDSAGEFVFPSLAVGEWTISAVASGFKQLVKPGVILQLGQVVDLELQLEVGEVTVTEMVTVTSAGQILQTATGEVSDVVERERVAELPLNGRQFLQLALLSEGVAKPGRQLEAHGYRDHRERRAIHGQRSNRPRQHRSGSGTTTELPARSKPACGRTHC
jgi:hypothetical protein